MVSLLGIGQKDPNLAVLNPPCCSAVLSLDPNRLLPFFEKAGFINDQYPTRAQTFAHIGLQMLSHFLALPACSVEQVLHGIGGCFPLSGIGFLGKESWRREKRNGKTTLSARIRNNSETHPQAGERICLAQTDYRSGQRRCQAPLTI